MEQAQSRKPALFLSEIVRISLNLQRPLRRGDDVIRNPFPLGIGLGRFQRGKHQLHLPPRIGGTSPASERIGPLCVRGFEFQHPFIRLGATRSEEHTSELQSLMRISYAVFCLKKKNKTKVKHS